MKTSIIVTLKMYMVIYMPRNNLITRLFMRSKIKLLNLFPNTPRIASQNCRMLSKTAMMLIKVYCGKQPSWFMKTIGKSCMASHGLGVPSIQF